VSKGYDSYNKLAEPEKARFGLLIRNILSSMQGAYIRHLAVDRDAQDLAGSIRMLDATKQEIEAT